MRKYERGLLKMILKQIFFYPNGILTEKLLEVRAPGISFFVFSNFKLLTPSFLFCVR